MRGFNRRFENGSLSGIWPIWLEFAGIKRKNNKNSVEGRFGAARKAGFQVTVNLRGDNWKINK